MAQVTVKINGYAYNLVCEDGQEPHLLTMAEQVEGRIESIAESQALARLDAALQDSVSLHCRSDGPYAMFLSGGIDSASVLRMMQRVSDQPVRAYTAAFDVRGAPDESEQASVLAHACGARHEVLRIDEAMVWRHLPEIVAAIDEADLPGAGSSGSAWRASNSASCREGPVASR